MLDIYIYSNVIKYKQMKANTNANNKISQRKFVRLNM